MLYGRTVVLLVKNPSTYIQFDGFVKWHLVGRNERTSRMLERHPFSPCGRSDRGCVA